MRSSTTFRAASFALHALLLASPRAHAWSNSPNLNDPIATGPGYEQAIRVLADGSGGVFVTWCTGAVGSLDVYAQHFDATGAPLWTPGGVLVCDAPDNQLLAPMAPDGAGGIVMFWNDFRNGSDFDLYAQHLNSAGVPLGTPNGVPVATGPSNQSTITFVADGANGLIVAWSDTRNGTPDIYAQRIGALATPTWTPNGVPVCTAIGEQFPTDMTGDGAGGAIFAWQDTRGATEYDVYAQRIDASGTPQWTPDGELVCGATFDQDGVAIASDNAGGAYVVWQDYRNGSDSDIFAQHLGPGGSPHWLVNGKQITSLPTTEVGSVAVADGTGGCIIAWGDYRAGFLDSDLYAQRLTGSGALLWTTNGVPICVQNSYQFITEAIPDGQGGVIVVWTDEQNPADVDLYAQRLSASGGPRWTLNGVAVSTAPTNQNGATLALDGTHGAYVGLADTRNGSDDCFIQRVEQFGHLGSPEPDLVSVRDVANDQGGRVRLSWNASYLDAGPGSPANEYRVWRQVPVSVAQERMGSGIEFRVVGTGLDAIYWELVGSQSANGFASYSLVTNTESDSVAGSNPYTVFMVEARQTSTGYHWDSSPDSGYSVDDLAPPTPAPFTGNYSDGTSYLQWGPNPAADLANYRLYRGATPSFVPSPITLVASPATTSYTDPLGSPRWYKVSAVDVHGNESGFATVLPGGTVDVELAGARELHLGPPTPNPARAGTAFRLTLPAAAPVRAEFFDQQGRLVRSLPERRLEAGDHEIAWDGRLASGAPALSGLYFYRVTIGERRMEGRIAIIR